MAPYLTAHHIGCLTENMAHSISHYQTMGFTNISSVYLIASQKVNVCFVEIKNGFYLELVEFLPDNTSLKRMFKNSNPYYHIGYLVQDISATIQLLQAQDFRLISQFNSEAFNGKFCAFLYSPEMHLVELIEA